MIWLEWAAKGVLFLLLIVFCGDVINKTHVPSAPVINWLGDTVVVAIVVGVAWLAMFSGWRA